MTPPKVYLPDNTPGFQSFDTDASGLHDEVQRSRYAGICRDVGKRRLESEWPQVHLAFDTSRKRDARRPDFGFLDSTLAMRASHVGPMGLHQGPEIELLPLIVDDEQWVLINAIYALQAFHQGTYAARRHPVHQDVIMAFHWVNILDPHVLEVELFKLPEGLGQTLVTQSFVERVHRLGLKGLRFRHIGYVVPDASQAIPKPPDPPEPAPARRSTRRRTVTLIAPLNRTEQRQIDAERLRMDLPARGSAAVDPVAETLSWLKAEVDAARPGFDALDFETQVERITRWMVPLGDLICEQLGWTWCALTHGRDLRWPAVANPSGTCAVALGPLLRRQLQSDEWILSLTWNLLQRGALPTAAPGEVAVIQ